MGQLIKYEGMMPEVAGGVFIADGARIIGDVTLHKGANVWFNTVLPAILRGLRWGSSRICRIM